MFTKKTAKTVLTIDLGLQAIFWSVNAVVLAFQSGFREVAPAVIAVLTLLDGAAFACFALSKRNRIFTNDYLLLLFLLANTVLTFTDQMGVFDYIILALNLLALLCCVYASDRLFRRKRTGKDV
jgi:hypothetical protein